ncbi:PhoD-like phosphatase [Frankia sp. EI5c]|uniref:DUF7800 domain-containing protein n=1 Tax=Frankia sp. EI5c TaxID=683316 RepID=UPI0007C222E8|nr:alkaline phosphatase D family protein [Frankia sp. EI5c]OAA18700.1 PhoD-like phosphatase [Frankia sp. EI5c]
MISLLLGPLHRFADDRHAAVWVETDAPCTVEVRTPDGPGATSPTFTVAGHHFALVVVAGLLPGTTYPYEVWLTPADSRADESAVRPGTTDETGKPGEKGLIDAAGQTGGTAAGRGGTPADRAVRVWPEPGSTHPPSLLRPVDGDRPVRLVFGSCRVTAPQAKPYTLTPGEDPRGLGTDALHALALRMAETAPSTWPEALLLLGDQVYADHVSPAAAARIRARRDVTQPPGEEIADFTEYCWLYQEAWSQPDIRWLLSTVPTAMIADDHDVRDDWNISAAWRARIRSQPWWDTRITSAVMAYWLYQHLGNLDPAALAADPTYAALTALDVGEDGADSLRALARRVDRMTDLGALAADPSPAGGDPDGVDPPVPPRWSYRWDLGRTRLIVIDSRLGRIVAPDGTRAMVNDADWSWIREQTVQNGEVDHLLLGTSVPYLLTPAIHHVETVSERLASGRFGRVVAHLAERARCALDLEHWAAFGRSFRQLTELVGAVAVGAHGPAPASVVVLSGDVHHAYLARADHPRQPTDDPTDGRANGRADGPISGSAGGSAGGSAAAPVWQAVCSPFRNPLGPGIRRIDALARRRGPSAALGHLARLLGVRDLPVSWTVTHGPWFDSQLATLTLDGRQATMLLEKTEPDGEPGGLDEVMRVALSPVEPAGQPKR